MYDEKTGGLNYMYLLPLYTRNSQTNAQSQLFLHQSFVQEPTVRYLQYIPVALLPVLYYMYYCRYTGCGILHTRASIVPICRAMSERVSESSQREREGARSRNGTSLTSSWGYHFLRLFARYLVVIAICILTRYPIVRTISY